ncbi:MAG: family 16 glycoside hydrolase [Bryobacteraceae bacterium]
MIGVYRRQAIPVWVNGAVISEKKDLTMLKGYIGLEAEGYLIEFRNLKLKEM